MAARGERSSVFEGLVLGALSQQNKSVCRAISENVRAKHWGRLLPSNGNDRSSVISQLLFSETFRFFRLLTGFAKVAAT